MKYIILIIATLILGGCSIGYDAEDLENDRRQDLIGYILGLDGHSETEYGEYDVQDYQKSVRKHEERKDL